MKNIIYIAFLSLMVSCAEKYNTFSPFSDPDNSGNWVLNSEVSDEFNCTKLDEDRWFIVGKIDKETGLPCYDHPDKPGKKAWTGRAPSQFSGNNHRFEDGILKLEARWEPNFPFIKEVRKPRFGNPLKYENITTPCIIGRRAFKYGYIEIRSKSADAELNNAFWSMGEGLEFDFFESFGDGIDEGYEHLDRQLWWSVRDWKKLTGKPSYTERKDVGFRFADDFHVYGVEWNKDYIKYYIDGKLFSSVTPEEATAFARKMRETDPDYKAADENYDGWVADTEINLWLSMAVYHWNGMPESKEELTRNGTPEQKAGGYMDFEIDYIRIWQKQQ